MHRITKIAAAAAGLALLALTTGGLAVASGTASAAGPAHTAAPAVVPGASAASNYHSIPLIRLVNTPGIALTTLHQVVTVQVDGAQGLPTDVTSVVGRIIAVATKGETLNVWDGVKGQPGTPTVISGASDPKTGDGASSAFTTGLSGGKLSVGNLGGSGKFLLEVTGYFEPVPTACVSKTFSITPAPVSLTHVGGSIRTGVTIAGSVDLPAGTYDARVLGNFTGLNTATAPAAFAGHQLYGTMVLIKGTAILPDFSNDITDGGVPIDQADSATLTVDPTTALDTFVTLDAPATVTVGFFAYLDNSQGFTSVDDAGHVKAAVQSAVLRSVC